MAGRLLPFGLLALASVASLPAIHGLVDPSLDFVARLYALYFGLIAMALAWAAGASLEDRRKGSVALLAALGALNPLLALVPPTRDVLGKGLWWMVAGSALSLAALALLAMRWRSR